MRSLLLHFAGEGFRRVLPAWAGQFLAADERAGGILGATLRAYASAEMNVLQAAQVLGVHPNTIYARLQRIHDVTGLQAKSYTALTELLIVADCESRRAARACGLGADALNRHDSTSA